MKLHDKVKVKSVKQIDPIWYGKEGEVIGIYGETKPFFYEVIVYHYGEKRVLLFKGDELEEV